MLSQVRLCVTVNVDLPVCDVKHEWAVYGAKHDLPVCGVKHDLGVCGISHELTLCGVKHDLTYVWSFFTFTYPLPMGVVGAPQMTSFLHFCLFFHCPLELGELQACPFPDFIFPPLPLSALSSSPFRCALHRWFWPDLMDGRHDHITAVVCVSLPWSGGLHVVRLPAGSWHGLPR